MTYGLLNLSVVQFTFWDILDILKFPVHEHFWNTYIDTVNKIVKSKDSF